MLWSENCDQLMKGDMAEEQPGCLNRLEHHPTVAQVREAANRRRRAALRQGSHHSHPIIQMPSHLLLNLEEFQEELVG